LTRTLDTASVVVVEVGELSELDEAIVALYAAVGRLDETVPVAVWEPLPPPPYVEFTVRVVTAVLPTVDLSYHRYAVVGGHVTVVIGGGSLCEVTFTSHKTSVPTLQLRLPVIVLDQ
jgi:hypothetical protein